MPVTWCSVLGAESEPCFQLCLFASSLLITNPSQHPTLPWLKELAHGLCSHVTVWVSSYHIPERCCPGQAAINLVHESTSCREEELTTYLGSLFLYYL